MAKTGLRAPITFKVNVRVSGPGGGDLPALLDQLRYERGEVVDWTHHADGTFDVAIRVDEQVRFQPERWQSFGVTPFDVDDEAIAFAYGLRAKA